MNKEWKIHLLLTSFDWQKLFRLGTVGVLKNQPQKQRKATESTCIVLELKTLVFSINMIIIRGRGVDKGL